MSDFWLENAATPGKHTLVDCGYLKDQAARDRADKLLEHVSRKNIEIAGDGRLLVRIPPTKVKTVLAAIPEIKEGAAGYCWCTHGFGVMAAADSRGDK